MRLALMSTWGIRCGIAEYTRNLARALLARDVDILIYGNIPCGLGQDELVVQDDEGFEVERNWSVSGWSGQITRPVINSHTPHVFHVQYESFLYSLAWFPGLLRDLSMKGHALAVTYHSAGIPPGFPSECVDLAFCHTPEILRSVPGRRRILLEMPAPCCRPRVGTFGLGRSNVEWLERACAELDLEFVNLVSTSGPWLAQDALIERLRACDVLALPYPPVGTSVSSASARLALAAMRPLVLSRTNWFSTVPQELATWHDWEYERFKQALARAVPAQHRFVREFSFDAAAARHVDEYAKL